MKIAILRSLQLHSKKKLQHVNFIKLMIVRIYATSKEYKQDLRRPIHV